MRRLFPVYFVTGVCLVRDRGDRRRLATVANLPTDCTKSPFSPGHSSSRYISCWPHQLVQSYAYLARRLPLSTFTLWPHYPRQTVLITMRISLPTSCAALASLLGVALAHNIQMGAHSRECFHENLHKDDKMTVSFQVGDREFGGSGNLEIDFWVCNKAPPCT